MLLMADFKAMEWRSPAVPPTVCDFGSAGLGMVEGADAEREGADVLYCTEDVGVECGAGMEGEEAVDGSAVWARAWDAGV